MRNKTNAPDLDQIIASWPTWDRGHSQPFMPSSSGTDLWQRARLSPIAEIAKRLGLKRGTSKKLTYRCPLHDDRTPSLSVTPGRGRSGQDLWLCFGCGEAGDGIALVAKVLGVSATEARDWIVGAPQ
jgi:DNA primase